ncbi:hypothetical protein AK812_SmicGene32729 [Symbiodinium microadriaticum]|uniref:Reticulocyte-binding protein 2-like a n=1 Tax=Symbiodinium microadriaticum TaxID=2951 RepID=A0A1Q9CTD5_SYMMI|nr:hypothetical protein AK812_SmicGene32729 [Symbiodinium microadriaticum]
MTDSLSEDLEGTPNRAGDTNLEAQEATQPWDGVPAPSSFDDDLEKELERLIFEEETTEKAAEMPDPAGKTRMQVLEEEQAMLKQLYEEAFSRLARQKLEALDEGKDTATAEEAEKKRQAAAAAEKEAEKKRQAAAAAEEAEKKRLVEALAAAEAEKNRQAAAAAEAEKQRQAAAAAEEAERLSTTLQNGDVGYTGGDSNLMAYLAEGYASWADLVPVATKNWGDREKAAVLNLRPSGHWLD